MNSMNILSPSKDIDKFPSKAAHIPAIFRQIEKSQPLRLARKKGEKRNTLFIPSASTYDREILFGGAEEKT